MSVETPPTPASGPAPSPEQGGGGPYVPASQTLPETTAIEFNVDGLPPVTRAEVETACDEVTELVQRFCGGTSRTAYLAAETPTISLAP